LRLRIVPSYVLLPQIPRAIRQVEPRRPSGGRVSDQGDDLVAPTHGALVVELFPLPLGCVAELLSLSLACVLELFSLSPSGGLVRSPGSDSPDSERDARRDVGGHRRCVHRSPKVGLAADAAPFRRTT
jgi:hypothetical protein